MQEIQTILLNSIKKIDLCNYLKMGLKPNQIQIKCSLFLTTLLRQSILEEDLRSLDKTPVSLELGQLALWLTLTEEDLFTKTPWLDK
jgi:hypothetical protein